MMIQQNIRNIVSTGETTNITSQIIRQSIGIIHHHSSNNWYRLMLHVHLHWPQLISKTKQHLIGRWAFICQSTFSIVFLAGITDIAQAKGKLPVIASFSILADMAERVGGDTITVTPIVDRNSDIHMFRASPGSIRIVEKAKVVILNGLGFDGWMISLINATGYEGVVVVATSGIETYHTDRSHVTQQNDRMDDGGQHDLDRRPGYIRINTDPHAWLNLKNALIYVENIRKGLCEADAENCASYAENAERYKTEIEMLDSNIGKQISAIPVNQRKIAIIHDAFSHFERAYGIEFTTLQGFDTEADTSAASIAGMIRQIKRKGICTIFYDNHKMIRIMKIIASETGAKIGGKIYIDSLSGQNGPAANYLGMVHHNMRQINKFLIRYNSCQNNSSNADR